MGAVAWWEVAAAIVTVTIAFAGVVRLVARHVRHTWRRVSTFLDDWAGTSARPGVPARRGVMERIGDQDQQLAEQSAALQELAGEVRHIRDELPKNGVPLSTKIDALWKKHLADERSHTG